MATLPLALAAQAADAVSLFDLAANLATASGPVMLGIVLLALLRGWLVLPREVEARDKRVTELIGERDEYKDMAFKAVGLGERVVSVAEERGRH